MFSCSSMEKEKESLLCLEGPLSEEDETLEKPAPTERPTEKGPKDKKKKPKKFRIAGKHFTLTYPQCSTKKEVAASIIDDNWGDELEGYLVAEEAHKDGTPHLHAFLKFKAAKQFYRSDCFDVIGGKHGSYEVTRHIRNWVTYCTKDGNFVAKGLDVDAIKNKKGSKSTEVAKMLMDGKSVRDVNDEDPGYVMMNKRKLEEYEGWIQCELAKKNKLDWVAPDTSDMTDTNKQIAEWICKNIRQPRVFKAPQLFIHGPRNLGKTSLIEWLEKFLSVYHIPMAEDFYDSYSEEFDLLVMDEFKGQKTIQWMNEFLQGSSMTLRKKGAQILKKKNLPCIILSNYSLKECYPKAHLDGRLNTLEARLEVVEIDSLIDFYAK